jgi:Flp pilus assembly protein TadG
MNNLWKKISETWGKRLGQFLQAQAGSALPFISLGIFMLVGATGTAVDMGRVQIVQSRMQNALDAAGLAAGSTVNTTDLNSETSKYFYANFPPGYMGTNINSLSALPNGDNSIINLAVAGTVNTTFMRIFGINEVAVSATSQITRQSKGMELVLVIDVTGSMLQSAGGSVTKLQAAKTASNTLLDVLYGSGNNTVPNLWVGLVPFSQAVNIGTGHASWTTADTFNWGTTSWYGCVDARETSNRDVTDDPPSVATFPKYYSPCDGNNQWYGTNSSRTNCLTGTGLGYRNGISTSSTYGPNRYCPQPVTPMVAEKSTVSSAINSMAARGNTLVNNGLVWGWRMLSPRWRGLWGGQMDAEGMPLDYDTALMYKVVVLMTDGDNTIDNSSWGAYWYLSSNKLGTTNSSTAFSRLNTRTTQVCNSMKAQGIIIYTIALGTSVSSTAQSMLQACATSSDYYFLSPTTNELDGIFQQIGDSLANLRISQ